MSKADKQEIIELVQMNNPTLSGVNDAASLCEYVSRNFGYEMNLKDGEVVYKSL